MTEIGGSLTTGEVFAAIQQLLDRHDTDRSAVPAASLLEWVGLARSVTARVEAARDLLIAEADKTQAAERAKGTPLTSWLGTQEPLSRKEANSAVFRARRLAEHPKIGEAVASGRLGEGQARAIGTVLNALSGQLNPAQQNQAEHVLLQLSDHLDADQLSKAAAQVLHAVAPADANELLERKLQREAETAQRQRGLRFFREGASVRFDGSLPQVEGERFIAMIDAGAEKLRRTAIEHRDRLHLPPTTEQRRADALTAILDAASATTNGTPRTGTRDARSPAAGTNHVLVPTAKLQTGRVVVPTAKVLVKLDYTTLRQMAADAGLIGDDQPISAGELRRLCCQAELIPVVLGGNSEPLDVGRSSRWVTPAILNALILRDGGCAFPGCGVPAHLCEAHHITPWWDGGPTAVTNLVLLCHSHHSLCEPAKYSVRDQWHIGIGTDGLPDFVPPARLDPNRTPLRNQRGPDRPATQIPGQARDDGGARHDSGARDVIPAKVGIPAPNRQGATAGMPSQARDDSRERDVIPAKAGIPAPNRQGATSEIPGQVRDDSGAQDRRMTPV